MSANHNFADQHQLYNLMVNSQLHLYNQVAQSDRYVPAAKRNTILTSYLKPRIKDKAYKRIKNSIKDIVLNAKSYNLESQISQHIDIYHTQKSRCADSVKLYNLLLVLEVHYQLDSKLMDSSVGILEENTLYLYEEHMEECFQAKSELLIRPLSILFKSEHLNLVDVINSVGLLNAEVYEHNLDTHCYHIQLHPNKHMTKN